MSRWRLFYHLVWATKGRQPLITPQIAPTVHRHLRQAAHRHNLMVHAVGGVADHVHLAVSLPPTLPVATAVQRIKGASSRAITEELGIDFGWQGDYSVDSFAGRHLAAVIAYIENQPRHHADGTLWSMIEELPEPSLPSPAPAGES
ncbi:MAG TPA: IS200/IS605 family transposase [Thermomicrobiaceae bacterium]|nr:IS200/IS605 family transposase [Thermomicrobiaceae bacterium]